MDKTIINKLDAFFGQFKHQTYRKGEIIIRADEDPAGIFYIKSGSVKMYAITQKGDEVVVNLFKTNAFFPIWWALNNTHNHYNFEAITEMEVWRAPKDETLVFLKNNPDVMYDLMCRIYRGMDGLLTRMTYLMSGSAYTRLITELIIHTKRFGTKVPDGSYEVKITENDLAAQSGITRETVSREMKQLKTKGLVEFNKSVLHVKDLAKLEEELSIQM